MNKRSVDSYVRFSGYNSLEKQTNQTNYSSNYNDLPPSQVPDPNNNRFANPPPQPLNPDDDSKSHHRVRHIESDKLHQLINDPNFRQNPRGPTKILVKVYTDWCGPCKRMAATSFMEDRVADVYNKQFIKLEYSIHVFSSRSLAFSRWRDNRGYNH